MKHKIGIVGFGGMAGWHQELIQEIEDLEIGGIYDIKEERQEHGRKLGLHTYDSLEQLLEDDSIDFILIATPNHLHKDIAIKAMKAGKHVISEKPVTLNSKDLQAMIDASISTGKLLSVHQNRRWDEDFLTVCRILEEEKLGEVFRIESRVHGSRGIPGDWRQEAEFGGGMVLDWGVHMFDQILMMLKGQKVVRVYATLTHVTNQLVDDGFYAELTMDSGVSVLVEVGTSNFVSLPRWYVMGQNGTAVIEDWEMNGKIVCANGVNELDVVPVKTAAGLTKTMAPRRDDSIKTHELPVVKSDIKDFYKNIMRSIEGTEKSLIQLDEVMRVMKLMEAVFESAKLGQAVPFE